MKRREAKLQQSLRMTVEPSGPAASALGFAHLLRSRAQCMGSQLAYHFITAADAEPKSIDYAELDGRAAVIASGLRAAGLQGRTVLLLFAPGLDYVSALFGCMYAGCIAVPAY